MHNTLTIISLGLYLLACALPAYKLDNSTYQPGVGCLIVGILAILYNATAFMAWLANIPYFVGVIFNFYPHTKVPIWVIVAQCIGLAMSFGAFGVKKFLLDEAGHESNATITYGAFVWIIAMALMLVASFFRR